MIEYITYENKQYPVRISFSALKRAKMETGRDLDQFDMEYMEPLLYFGLIAGCKADGRTMPFKREDIEYVLDECLAEFVGMLPKFFEVMTLQPGEKQKSQKGTKKN